jgi:hypothetical protein
LDNECWSWSGTFQNAMKDAIEGTGYTFDWIVSVKGSREGYDIVAQPSHTGPGLAIVETRDVAEIVGSAFAYRSWPGYSRDPRCWL